MVTPRPIPERGPMRRYAEAINQLSDLADALKIQPGIGYTVHRTAHGQTIKLTSRRAALADGGSDVQRFVVQGLQNDYLICRKLGDNGQITSDATNYNVAKPPQLRVSTLLGNVISHLGQNFTISFPTPAEYGNSRRLTSLSDSRYVDEALDPVYKLGSEIYACEATGQTGVSINGARMTWVDINVDARHYRPKYQRVAVCVQENGQTVTRYMYVAGGPIQA